MLTAPSPIQNEEYARLQDLERNVLPQYSRGMFARMTPEQARAEQAVQNFYKQNKEQIVREPGLYEAFKRDPVGVAFGRVSTQREAVGKVAAPTDTSYAAAEEARARARQQMVGQAPAAPAQAQGIAQAAPSQVPPGIPPGQAVAKGLPVPGGGTDKDITPPQLAPEFMPYKQSRAPRPEDEFQRYDQSTAPARAMGLERRSVAGAPQGQGIAQAVPSTAGAQPPAPTQPGGLQAAYEQAGIGALTGKPEAASMSAEEAYAKRFDPLFQQQLALKQQGIAEAQRLAERERAMRDPLMAWMAGARGRTIGEVLGNAGRAGMEYQQQGLTRDQALAQQLQDLREAQLGAQITQEKEKYGVGEARRKETADERKAAYGPTGQYLANLEAADVRRENAQLRMQLGVDEKTANMIRQRIESETTIINNKYKTDPRAKRAVFEPEVAAQLERERINEIQKSKREIYAEFGKAPPEEAGITSVAPSTGTKTIPFSQLKSAGK